MTTRSWIAASADPAAEISNSPDQAGPSDTSVAATVDHDNMLRPLLSVVNSRSL